MLLLFDDTVPLLQGFNAFWLALGGVIAVSGALITIIALKKTNTSTLQVQRADAAEGIIKLNEIEKKTLEEKLKALEEELEDTTAELRTQTGINVDQLMSYWAIRDKELARMEYLEKRCKILQDALDIK